MMRDKKAVDCRLETVGKRGGASWSALPCFLFRPIAYSLQPTAFLVRASLV
jgi:hypothetical protein